MSEIQAEDINFQTRVYNGNTVTINKLKEDLKDGIIIWTTGSGASPSGNSHYKQSLQGEMMKSYLNINSLILVGVRKNYVTTFYKALRKYYGVPLCPYQKRLQTFCYYKAIKKRLCPKNILPSLSLIEMMSPIYGLCSTSITSPSIQSDCAVNCGLTFILSPIFGSIFYIHYPLQRYDDYPKLPNFWSFFCCGHYKTAILLSIGVRFLGANISF